MLLYKYSDWNNKHTKENLKLNRLYFNIATNFNDPFDMYPSYQILNRKLYNNQQKKYLQKERGYTKKNARIASTLMSNRAILNTAIISMRYHKAISRYGITCFSENNSNMLMWSHYAKNHSGICLGFDIPTDNISLFFNNTFSPDIRLLKINYTSIRPTLPLLKKDLTYENILPIFRDKSFDWQYEKEHRLLLLGEKNSFPSCLTYNPQYLKEIILGANIHLNDFIDFYEFKKSTQNLSKTKIFIMTLNSLEYKLNLNKFDEASLDLLYNNLIFLKQHLKYLEKLKHITDNEKINAFDNIPLNLILTICNLFSKELLTNEILSKKNSLAMQVYDFMELIINQV